MRKNRLMKKLEVAFFSYPRRERLDMINVNALITKKSWTPVRPSPANLSIWGSKPGQNLCL